MSEAEEQEQTLEVPETEVEKAVEAAAEAVAVQVSQLSGLEEDERDGEPIGIDNLLDVPVKVTVHVGRTQITLGELMKLRPGSLVPLDREAHEPADILVNGKVVAKGEVVTIDESYGVRITDVLTM